ncbi:MAG: ABC transporter ATP-binding protein [Candidatus Thermoplasmatota archaeon]
MPAIELQHVTKRFGSVTAVEDVNLKVEDGEYVTLLGPSGCGKTTIVKMIAGVYEPTEGRVLIDGKDMGGVQAYERDVGYVFQNIAVFPHMTAVQNASYSPLVKGLGLTKAREIARDALCKVRLDAYEHEMPSALSSGTQQKVGIARALASGARIIIFDEPLSALDARVRLALRYELRRYAKELGLTTIHVTHDQEEAMAVSDRILVMRAGRVMEAGTPPELYMTPKHLFTAHFIGQMNFLHATVLDKRDGTLEIEGRKGLVIGRMKDANGFAPGDAVILACRPELTRLVEGDGVPGTVSRTAFMGGYVRYFVRLATDEEILVDARFDSTGINTGDEVRVAFDPGGTLLYHVPKEGLKEVLRLE